MLKEMVRAVMRVLQPPSLHRPMPFALFRFRSMDDLEKWICISDKEIFGGFSTASVKIMPEGYVRFSGHLSTKLPNDPTIVRSGFCLFRTRQQRVRKFYVDSLILPILTNHFRVKKTLLGGRYIDMNIHDALEFEIRGDGRAYIANLQPDSYREEDLYQATIYTRGGPHWQTVQVPLSDFLLTHRGYVQNEQSTINPTNIKTVGILLADKRDGPFQIDIREIRATSSISGSTIVDKTKARMRTEWKSTVETAA